MDDACAAGPDQVTQLLTEAAADLNGVNPAFTGALGAGRLDIGAALELLPPSGPCPADVDGDGVVGAADLLELIGNFGPCPGSSCIWDVNGDGVVDQADVQQVLQNMGPCEGCPEDINGDGVVNGQDVAAVAKHLGPCP